MKKNQGNEREQMEILPIEQLVSQNHLVRKLDAASDFSFIYPLVENLYSIIIFVQKDKFCLIERPRRKASVSMPHLLLSAPAIR